ncbi:MAG: 16S rRNA (adenine(1518)-N(6)/adenine(1519)-N(6))-dimethyltransferase RsmA [Candidatus Paceibacterota bacterium]
MIRAKKSLGQNFLINEGVLDKIVQAAEVGPEDIVIEIGPGTGNLTKKLAEKAGRVIAIEKDHRLIEFLKNEFSPNSAYAGNVEIVEGDVLDLDIEKLFRNLKLEIRNSNYKVIGNIPYYITSHFLRKIFSKWPTPKLIVLTVQKEVAKRITAKPGDMNLLALSIQLYSEPEIIMNVSKNSFRPVPKVDSAIIKLITHDLQPTTRARNEKILQTAKKAFAGKRKQLKNTLPEINLKTLGINPETRPEELAISDWLKISSVL